MPEATFIPLSRNRYRCVQTGVVVKKRALAGYRANLVNRGRTARRKPEVVVRHVKIETFRNDCDCPDCGRSYLLDEVPTTVNCDCGVKLSITRRKLGW